MRAFCVRQQVQVLARGDRRGALVNRRPFCYHVRMRQHQLSTVASVWLTVPPATFAHLSFGKAVIFDHASQRSNALYPVRHVWRDLLTLADAQQDECIRVEALIPFAALPPGLARAVAFALDGRDWTYPDSLASVQVSKEFGYQSFAFALIKPAVQRGLYHIPAYSAPRQVQEYAPGSIATQISIQHASQPYPRDFSSVCENQPIAATPCNDYIYVI